jgi:hypothetical protein
LTLCAWLSPNLFLNVCAKKSFNLRYSSCRLFVGTRHANPSVLPRWSFQKAVTVSIGYPGYELPIWIGLSVPAGTPTDRIDALNRAMREALNDEEVKKRMLALGVTAVGSTPSEFAAFLEKERVRWVTMVKETGVLDR